MNFKVFVIFAVLLACITLAVRTTSARPIFGDSAHCKFLILLLFILYRILNAVEDEEAVDLHLEVKTIPVGREVSDFLLEVEIILVDLNRVTSYVCAQSVKSQTYQTDHQQCSLSCVSTGSSQIEQNGNRQQGGRPTGQGQSQQGNGRPQGQSQGSRPQRPGSGQGQTQGDRPQRPGRRTTTTESVLEDY